MKKAVIFALIAALVAGPVAAHAKDGELKGSLGLNLFGERAHVEIENEHTRGDDNTNNDAKDDVKRDDKKRDDSRISIDVRATSKDRAVAEIDRRIDSLQKLEARVDAMKRVSANNKTQIKATVDAQIKTLADLKVKIQGDTDEATLKADIASITKSYRVYMLVMPQLTVLAAADRIEATVDVMTEFGTKLQTRISDAKSAGKDVSSMESAYASYKTHLANADAKATSAINLTAGLKPDNGDKSVMESNNKALASARVELKSGRDELHAARKDAEIIVKALK